MVQLGQPDKGDHTSQITLIALVMRGFLRHRSNRSSSGSELSSFFCSAVEVTGVRLRVELQHTAVRGESPAPRGRDGTSAQPCPLPCATRAGCGGDRAASSRDLLRCPGTVSAGGGEDSPVPRCAGSRARGVSALRFQQPWTKPASCVRRGWRSWRGARSAAGGGAPCPARPACSCSDRVR